jgi:hypothetical protein
LRNWFPGIFKRYSEPDIRRLWPDDFPRRLHGVPASAPAPVLQAEFVLGSDGFPVSARGGSEAPIYLIRLSLRDVPLDAVSYVTYDLHPEHNRRERTVRIPPHFEHTIYSWGDYRIRVRLSDGSEIESRLSDALRSGYYSPPSPEIASAVQSIAAHPLAAGGTQ